MASDTRCLRTAVSLTACFALSALAQAPSPPVRPRSLGQRLEPPTGEPDLQGSWTDDTYTPLERPARARGQGVLHARGSRGVLQVAR